MCHVIFFLCLFITRGRALQRGPGCLLFSFDQRVRTRSKAQSVGDLSLEQSQNMMNSVVWWSVARGDVRKGTLEKWK